MPQANDKRSIPKLMARAVITPNTYNEKDRTVEVVWTTGAKVLRGGFWSEPFFEELSLDKGSVRMDRLNGGAPVLNAHNQDELCDQIGVVDKAWLEPTDGKAILRFSEREDVAPIVQDVKSGIIRNISVGYRVYKYQEVTPPPTEGQPPPTQVFRAIDWEPFEISFVPVPADAGAQVRNQTSVETNEVQILRARAQEITTKESSNMPEAINKETAVPAAAAAPVPAGKSEIEIRKEAVAQERERILEIRKSCEAAGLDSKFAEDLVKKDVDVNEARKLVIDEMAKNAKPAARAQIAVGRDETVSRREAMQLAIECRSAPHKNKVTELCKPFMSRSLFDMARMCVENAGINTDMLSKLEITQRAFHSTSDFPAILQNVLNKSLRQSYEASPRTFQPFSRRASSADFKTISRTQLSDFPSFTKVSESGEFKYGQMSDGKETYSLATYGKIIGITRQAIINDDLSAFDRVPTMIGSAAADLESDIVWAILTDNAALSDNIALFHASHNNYTSSGTVISVANLGVGKAKLRAQKNLQNRPLNLMPKVLAVPVAIETVAQQFLSNAYVAQQGSNINPFAGQLTLVVEPRLDAVSATAWYMFADPARIDTLEYCYLDGNEGVFTEQEMGFDVDGMKIKARHDFAAKAIDYRGMYKNVGA